MRPALVLLVVVNHADPIALIHAGREPSNGMVIREVESVRVGIAEADIELCAADDGLSAARVEVDAGDVGILTREDLQGQTELVDLIAVRGGKYRLLLSKHIIPHSGEYPILLELPQFCRIVNVSINYNIFISFMQALAPAFEFWFS